MTCRDPAPERGAFADFPIPERNRAVPAAPTEEGTIMKRREASISGVGPEWDSFFATRDQGRVPADRPPRRGESRDRP